MKKQYFFYGIVGILVLIQFFGIDKENPPTEEAQDFLMIASPPAEIGQMLKEACYDCHSNYTKYPWYTHVQPVGWWVKNHVNEGRRHLNFSEWGTYEAKRRAHKMEESYEEVEEGHMPLQGYPLMHPEAKLSDQQREMLVAYFKQREQLEQ